MAKEATVIKKIKTEATRIKGSILNGKKPSDTIRDPMSPPFASSVSAIASYIRSRKMEDPGRATVQQM